MTTREHQYAIAIIQKTIENFNHFEWCQGHEAFNLDNKPTSHHKSDAISLCLLGGLRRSNWDMTENQDLNLQEKQQGSIIALLTINNHIAKKGNKTETIPTDTAAPTHGKPLLEQDIHFLTEFNDKEERTFQEIEHILEQALQDLQEQIEQE